MRLSFVRPSSPSAIRHPLSSCSLALLLLTGCNPAPTTTANVPQPPAGNIPVNVVSNAATADGPTPTYSYDVIHIWPHDRGAFTQGLVFLDGQFLESTGLNGESTLRRVDLQTGKVLKQIRIPEEYFGEGIAVLNGKIFHLTWQNNKGFVYDLETFKQEKEFAYEGEGWGLATDGQSLIMSDRPHPAGNRAGPGRD